MYEEFNCEFFTSFMTQVSWNVEPLINVLYKEEVNSFLKKHSERKNDFFLL